MVDWKTSQHAQADPLQLAVYRLAWAELHQKKFDSAEKDVTRAKAAGVDVSSWQTLYRAGAVRGGLPPRVPGTVVFETTEVI